MEMVKMCWKYPGVEKKNIKEEQKHLKDAQLRPNY